MIDESRRNKLVAGSPVRFPDEEPQDFAIPGESLLQVISVDHEVETMPQKVSLDTREVRQRVIELCAWLFSVQVANDSPIDATQQMSPSRFSRSVALSADADEVGA